MRKGYARFATKEIQTDSIVDGEGIRSVIWFQGCSHNCPGCHNPETHDFKAGVEVSLKTMKKQIDEIIQEVTSYITYITEADREEVRIEKKRKEEDQNQLIQAVLGEFFP